MSRRTPLGDELRLLAVPYATSGNRERAEGLVQAADLVDQRAALLTGAAMADLLRGMMREQLEEFVADIVSALRSDETPRPEPIELPPPRIVPRQRKPAAVAEPLSPAVVSFVEGIFGASASGEGPEAIGEIVRQRGPRMILTAIAQHAPTPVTRSQITALTGFKKSTRDEYLRRLLGVRAIAADGDGLIATGAGERVLGPGFERLPTGSALLAHWLRKLHEGERSVLQYVASFGGHAVHRAKVTAETGYKKSTRDEYLRRLIKRRLVHVTGREHVGASAHLFDAQRRAHG